MTQKFTVEEKILAVLGIIGLIVLIVLWILPLNRGTQEHAREVTCMSNQKQIALSFMMYIQDNQGIIPEIDDNIFSTLGVSGKVLTCPNATGEQSYVVNARLSNLELGKTENPISVWLTADAKTGVAGPVGYGANDMEIHHRYKTIIASYVDGHAAFSKKISDVTEDIPFKMKAVGFGYGEPANPNVTVKYAQGFKYVPFKTEEKNLIIELPDDPKNMPNISYAVNINGLKILSKPEKNENIRMFVVFYLGGVEKDGQVKILRSINTPYNKGFNAENFTNDSVDIKTPPLLTLWTIKKEGGYLESAKKYEKFVLYPVINFYTSKKEDEIKIDSVDIVTLGQL